MSHAQYTWSRLCLWTKDDLASPACKCAMVYQSLMVDQREDLLRIVTSSTSFAPADILTEGSFPFTLVRALVSIPIILLVAWQLFFFFYKIFKTRQNVRFLPSSCFFCWNISLGRLCYPPIRKYLPLLSYRSRWCWTLISELTRVRIHNPTRPHGTHYKALARVLHSITSLAICAPSVPF